MKKKIAVLVFMVCIIASLSFAAYAQPVINNYQCPACGPGAGTNVTYEYIHAGVISVSACSAGHIDCIDTVYKVNTYGYFYCAGCGDLLGSQLVSTLGRECVCECGEVHYRH